MAAQFDAISMSGARIIAVRRVSRRNIAAGELMARLTTHVLDTAHGAPADGVAVRLYSLGDERTLLVTSRTNSDGRTDRPLLDGDTFEAATYELEFDIGDYFANAGVEVSDPPFLDTVVIRVRLRSGERYHVPLLATPWSYATYRGS